MSELLKRKTDYMSSYPRSLGELCKDDHSDLPKNEWSSEKLREDENLQFIFFETDRCSGDPEDPMKFEN